MHKVGEYIMDVKKVKIAWVAGALLTLGAITNSYANYGFYIIPKSEFQSNQFNHGITLKDQINHQKINLYFDHQTLGDLKKGDQVTANSQTYTITRLEKEEDYYLLELDNPSSERPVKKSIWQFPYG